MHEKLRNARLRAGLSYDDLGERAGIEPKVIWLFETGSADIGFEEYEQLLRMTRHSAVVVSVVGVTAHETSVAMMRSGGYIEKLTLFNRYCDALGLSTGMNRLLLALEAPVSTGEELWDAALFSETRRVLEAEGLPLPDWLDEPLPSSEIDEDFREQIFPKTIPSEVLQAMARAR